MSFDRSGEEGVRARCDHLTLAHGARALANATKLTLSSLGSTFAVISPCGCSRLGLTFRQAETCPRLIHDDGQCADALTVAPSAPTELHSRIDQVALGSRHLQSLCSLGCTCGSTDPGDHRYRTSPVLIHLDHGQSRLSTPLADIAC